jgi:hypothetical protein
MTTVFNQPVPLDKADTTHYHDALEAVAPNITQLLTAAATLPENWWETLVRVLPTINSSPEQDSQLMALAIRASNGLEPVGYVAPPAPSTATPMTAEKFLTYAGVASVLWRIFF